MPRPHGPFATSVALLSLTALALSPFDYEAPGADDAVGRSVVPRGDAVPIRPPVAQGGPTGRSALDSDWVLRSDRRRRGSALGWQNGGFDGWRVRVPLSPNARYVTGPRGLRSFLGSVAWYRTEFRVARGGAHALRFESVNHRATVWVDGRRVARHTGTYLPFEARMRLAPGRHVLVVRADWRGPLRMKHNAWHRTWFNFGGINREVTLRRLGQSELDAPGLVTRLRDGAAHVRVWVRVRNRGPARTLRVRGTLGGRELDFPTVPMTRGEVRVVRAELRVENPRLWAPRRPRLQTLHLEVPGEAGWRQRVGLREVRAEDGRLLVNDKRVRLRGASLHEDAKGRGDALLPADMDAIVDRLKAIGANATRAQHPLNPALLERLDAAGILVWQGVGPVDAPGAWTSTTPELRRRARRRARLNVVQARMHPSIVVWNLANEVSRNGREGGQRQYIESAARDLHQIDPGRLVAVDVWGTHLPRVAGRMYRDVDAIGVTNYAGWYKYPLEPAPVVEAEIGGFLERVKALWPGKVLVVTEFGAEANGLNATESPGGYDFQRRLVTSHIRAYRKDPRLSGMLVWNIQDFALTPVFAGGSIRRQVPGIVIVRGINQKGLFTYGGRAKPAAATVRRLFRGR